MNDLRLELKARNNVLWHFIFDSCGSVAEFVRIHQLTNKQGQIGELLNLKASPYRNDGSPTDMAKRLSVIASMLVEDLFPVGLYSGVVPSKMVAEVSSDRFRSLAAARHLALPPTQDDGVLDDERHHALADVLRTLTPNERSVIEMSFGINDDSERTASVIAQELGVCDSRVQQIREKALRKLRHPAQLRRLRGLLV